MEIATRHRSYRRDYLWVVEVTPAKLRLPRSSWPWSLLTQMAAASAHEPLQNARVTEVVTCLSWASKIPELHSVLRLPPDRVTPPALRRFFERAEREAAKETPRRVLRTLKSFSTEIFRYAPSIFHLEISRWRVGFVSKVPYRPQPRMLISDFSGPNGPPIGALPFNSYRELQAEQARRLEADLQLIRDACLRDINVTAHARACLRELSQASPPTSHIELAMGLADSRVLETNAVRAALTDREMLHLCAFIYEREQLFLAGARPYGIPRPDALATEAFAPYAVVQPPVRFMDLQHFATPVEVFAAILLLNTYAGWNFTTLTSLTPSGITELGEYIELHSAFKDKTDDHSPTALLETAALGVRECLELLRWNRMQLLRAGFVEDFEGPLYVTRRSLQGPHPRNLLVRFTSDHRIPWFTLDQIRTQVLYASSINGKNGIELARMKGGHSEISVTGIYLDQEAARRMHSAVNLEFQRRLEKEIVYLGADPSKRKLLRGTRAVGDGSTCGNPSRPPPAASVDTEGRCAGGECHLGAGCDNRRVFIDEGRMREVLLTRAHLQRRHHHMMSANPERFARFVVPSMAFNEALHSVLKSGPHGDFYAKLAEELEHHDDKD